MTVIKTEGLRKEYGPLVAVDNLSFSVEKGDVLGLIGPNGAGKTTLLKMLSSAIPPTNGRIEIMGESIDSDYLKARGRIGYLPDFFNLYGELTLVECLGFFARAYGVETARIPERIDATLRDVGLIEKRDAFIENLSRGMIQRLGIGVSMVHDPDIFLLDEPASGLDPRARIDLRELLKKLADAGKTIVISSHILTELSGLCTHIAIVNQGALVLFGEVNDIQERLVGAKKVRLTVIDSVEHTINVLKEHSTLRNITACGRTIVFETRMTAEEMADLNKTLVTAGIRVYGLAEEKSDLEDLFLKLSETDSSEGNGPV